MENNERLSNYIVNELIDIDNLIKYAYENEKGLAKELFNNKYNYIDIMIAEKVRLKMVLQKCDKKALEKYLNIE